MSERRLVWLAGSSFYDLSLFCEAPQFPQGLRLTLEREPSNQYDPNATCIFLDAAALRDAKFPLIPDGKERFKLGHVPAKDGTAAWLAPIIDAGAQPVSAFFERHSSSGPAIQIAIDVGDAA